MALAVLLSCWASRPAISRWCLGRAESSRERGDYLALARWLEHLAPHRFEGSPLFSRRLGLEAALRRQRGEVVEARRLGEQALAAAPKGTLRSRLLLDLAALLATAFDSACKAESLQEEALGIARAEGDSSLEAEALLELGESTWRREKSEERYRQEFLRPALELSRGAGERRGEARALHRLGLLELAAGRFAASRVALTTAHRLYEQHRALGDLAEAHLALGALEIAEQRFRPGFEHYQRGLELAERLGCLRGAQNARRLLADYALRQGDYPRAIALSEELLGGSVPPLPGDLRRLHTLVGGAALHLGDTGRALANYRAVLDVTPPGHDDALRTRTALMVGHARLERGELDEAEEAFELAESSAEAVRRAGQPEAGQRVWLLLAWADLEELRGRRMETLARLAAAVELEAQTQAGGGTHFQRAQYWQIYRRLPALLFAETATPGERSEAARLLFRFTEQMRFRSLRGTLSGRDEEPGRPVRPVDLGRLERRLDRKTVLVEYLFSDEQALALVIRRRRIEAVRLPLSKTAIEAKARLLAARLQLPGRHRSEPAARDLDAALVEPLRRRGLLEGIERLGVVPMAFLAELPFAALVSPPKDGGGGRFLVEDHDLFLAPSASLLVARWEQARSVAPWPALAFGWGLARRGLPALPHAVGEAREVARLWNGEARLGGGASELTFRRLAPKARLIHIATHAVSQPAAPAASGLYLAAGDGEDGTLTVAEIQALQLNADLVTLSGCRTGLSHSLTGNELAEDDRAGLVEAFLEAGARAVVASLWPVEDRPTAEMMATFYRRLLAGDGPARALAEAQRRALEGEGAANWAAFVVVGAPTLP